MSTADLTHGTETAFVERFKHGALWRQYLEYCKMYEDPHGFGYSKKFKPKSFLGWLRWTYSNDMEKLNGMHERLATSRRRWPFRQWVMDTEVMTKAIHVYTARYKSALKCRRGS